MIWLLSRYIFHLLLNHSIYFFFFFSFVPFCCQSFGLFLLLSSCPFYLSLFDVNFYLCIIFFQSFGLATFVFLFHSIRFCSACLYLCVPFFCQPFGVSLPIHRAIFVSLQSLPLCIFLSIFWSFSTCPPCYFCFASVSTSVYHFFVSVLASPYLCFLIHHSVFPRQPVCLPLPSV